MDKTIPPALPGFSHVQRLWRAAYENTIARILPGEYYVTKFDEIIATTLGSCISVCIRDRRGTVGGMNHFMLPGGSEIGGGFGFEQPARYGIHAMESLINSILNHGGARNRLEIKVFGGADMLGTSTPVGKSNVAFINDFLRTEGMAADATEVGDICARKVLYYPRTGRVRVAKLKRERQRDVLAREAEYKKQLVAKPIEGEVELF